MRLLLCALLTFCAFAAAAADRDYVLPLGQGRVITLPRDARDVFVGSPDVAEIVANTPRVYYISGAKIGATNAIFIDSAGNQVADIAIRVEADVAGLKTALRQALPDADINVQAAGDKLFLTGNVLSASAASMAERLAKLYVKDEKGLVNLLKVAGGDQILLRVRVAEMRRSVAKQLGIKSLAVEGGNIRLSGGRPANGSFGELSFSINSSAFDALTGTIDALEDEGLVRTLAEPNLTAISGEAANFLAGGEFPVPISRDLQGNSIVEFKPFGVGLNFTPVVISSGRISLKMATEVSSLSEEGAQTVGQLRIPGLSVRRVETTVEMASGSSLIVAGLLRNDATSSLSGLPWLSDVPVIGSLFRSTAFQRSESELVVLVTPYLVRPTRDDRLSLPTAGVRQPDDAALFLLRKLGFNDPSETLRNVKEPIGYVLD
ncbi:type II and III secretion system protein family protein [Elstera cyanobacteriorum]|uniref:type II and III secretion system protein family protein n=1 Tax=Elstera cyanobacteriorum TaxID=2022747 RepID=UPI00235792F2|nr:type II and III secretion system protein family protein [Elstera cyanobacteriorum]MCK6441600.1 type II and III secretion system protein family protein [Elstera cyanobacteriorum]